MAEPENKDKIKEILEGHNKKFTTTELIVGIIVLLIIGCGIGYAIFKLLTPAPTQIPPANTVTEVQQPAIPQTTEEENAAVNQETNQAQPPVVQNNTTTEEKNQYQNLENNTAQNTNVQTSQQNQVGPNIIPPTSTSNKVQEQTPTKATKTQTSYKPKRVTPKTTTVTERAEHKRHIKKHVYTHITKYYIQVSSNKNRKLALLNVIKLRKCGHNAFTKEVEVKGVKYTRVYVGPIKGYTVAKQEAKEIKKQLHLEYLPLIKKDD